jgi:hypothetical protein
MIPSEFTALATELTGRLEGRPLDRALEDDLNRLAGASSELYRRLEAACRRGVTEGWLCQQGEGRRRFGRVLQPGPETHGFSVDVVEIDDLAGPHHRHPTGEICAVFPVQGPATFDGRGAGWVVYPPGSGHRPTVAGGRALVLYLLPGGHIEFTPVEKTT